MRAPVSFLIGCHIFFQILMIVLCQKEKSIPEKLKTSEKADKSELNDLSNPSEVSRFIHGPRFPKQNCSVLDEVLTADICTPAFETQCEKQTIVTKKIIEVDFCFTINKTVCSVGEEIVNNEICTYVYSKKEEASTAQTVVTNFEKKCRKQKVTVCDYSSFQNFSPFDSHTFGFPPVCKEVAQETCFNVPGVQPVDIPVSLAYPEPIKTCENVTIHLPKVDCQIESDEKCIKVPDLEELSTTVEKCLPALSTPKCRRVDLVLPKQICQDIIYGFTHRPIDFQE